MKKDWPWVPLGEVLQQRKEFITIDDLNEYKRCRVQLHAKGVVLRDLVKGSEIKTKKQQVCKAGEFLVAEIDAKVGGYGIVPEELEGAIVSSHYFLFEANQEKLDLKFLDYFSKTPLFHSQVAAQGSTNYASIRPQHVYEYQIPLPPIDEQRRVVRLIRSLESKLQKVNTLKQRNQENIDSLINALLSKFLQINDNTWADGLLGDYIIDDCYGTSEKTDDYDIGIPILRMGNIQNGHLNFKDLKFLPFVNEKLILQKGDILVNRTNSAELVGKSAVFDIDGEYSFASYLIRLRADTDKVNPYFICRYINSSIGRSYMFKEKKQMTGQANVNAKKIKQMPIKLPTLERQNEIVNYINSIEQQLFKLNSLSRQENKELKALLPSLLDSAFKGEL
jgi:type I restriction enzyme S subunit